MHPNFLVIGAAKAGTTAVYDHLAQHPDIFLPALKEPHFLALYPESALGPLRDTSRVVRTPADYHALFADGQDQERRGEAATSTLYFAHRSVVNIADHCAPDTKMIALLRHPVDRAYSAFNHARRVGSETEPTFERALAGEQATLEANGPLMKRYLDVSRYADQLAVFFDAFGSDRVHVALYDDLVSDRKATLDAMFRFLDLEPVETTDGAPANASYVPDSSKPIRRMLYRGVLRLRPLGNLAPAPIQRRLGYVSRRTLLAKPDKLDPSLRRALTEQCAGEVERLAKLLDRDLTEWTTPA